jgi:tetratricopeptide (TPR) repeat protein
MTRRLTIAALGAACLILAPGRGPIAFAAQHVEGSLPPDFNEPIRLYTTGLGTFARPISSSNANAQAYFTQGFRLMYAFAKNEAGRSFREAQRLDPNCAICFWGEAWAWGPYVNGRMTPHHAAKAYAAIQKGVALAEAHANAKEQAFIRAMAARYVERFDADSQVERDRAYADAMQRVAATYPDDLDAATLYAEALFLLLPRPGAFDLEDPAVVRLTGVLEAALKRDVRHTGACHMYIHTMELTSEAQRAAACAEHLGSAMPAASHINHMPAHVWTKVGRWGDAVRASLQAWQSDQQGVKGNGIATYPAHDLQMLAIAASMDGQSSLAIQAGRGLTRLTGDPMYHALTLVRFGRFADIAGIGERPASDLGGGIWDFAHGYAKLRAGDPKGARERLDRVLATASSSRDVFKIHPAKTLLGTLGAILEGEIRRAEGDMPGAIVSLERAVSIEDGLLVDDPEPLPLAARHWLGAALLAARRFADAERVYRADLTRHPRNGWALIGLKQALEAQGKPSAAAAEAFRASWIRSDTPLQASRF